MTEMQVHEEQVMNLVESSSGNPTITPLTKTNAHRAESIRRIGTDKDVVAFHFRKKSKGMYMYIHTYTENGEEKELHASDFKNWEVTKFKYPGYLEAVSYTHLFNGCKSKRPMYHWSQVSFLLRPAKAIFPITL